MNKPFLIFTLCATTLAAPMPPDTHLCSYWLNRLDDVARLERALVIDVESVRHRDGPYSAQEFQFELRGQMRKLLKNISEDMIDSKNGGIK